MTEREWLAARWPRQALDTFCSPSFNLHRKKAGRRKLRLFQCACCRRIQHLIPEDPGHQALALAERLCEGDAVADGVAALQEQERRIDDTGHPLESRHARHAAMASMDSNIWYAVVTGSEAAARAAGWHHLASLGIENMALYYPAVAAEQLAQVPLLHDVFGNPFRPVTIAPALRRWNDRTLVSLAQSIYDERAFDRLPILGDALTDSGCDDEDILAHCRSEGPHVRGCWVVDLILSKT